jgi:hypothetical protein
MPLKGLGDCGICNTAIQDPKTGIPSPVRHFKGHQLAHKKCYDEWMKTDKRLARSIEARDRLNAQIGAMTGDRDRLDAVIDELSGPKV